MSDFADTIVAVSSGTAWTAAGIIRISGPAVFDILQIPPAAGILQNPFQIDKDLTINVTFYRFVRPYSYTGDDLVEIHLIGSQVIIDAVYGKLLAAGCRAAGPGEFTARAYLNGKIDLMQAEAVAQIVGAAGMAQIKAAENLLSGRLSEKITAVKQNILELLSLTEAGLDFSQEDIEFITACDAQSRCKDILLRLNAVLERSIRFERTTEVPGVVIAGLPNAGKSSLMNALTKTARSIVSDRTGTTRDVLECMVQTEKSSYLLLDCAGVGNSGDGVIDALARAATIEAIKRADLVLYCVDITRDNFQRDAELLAEMRDKKIILAATKCDISPDKNKGRQITEALPFEPVYTSSVAGMGIDELCRKIEDCLIATQPHSDLVAVTQRHVQAVCSAAENLESAGCEFADNHFETAALFLRAAMKDLTDMENEHIDEKILDGIFSRFCVGK